MNYLNDKRLSLKAKGLFALVLSTPEDWKCSVKSLKEMCKENETAIKSALEELKEQGYLIVIKRHRNGRLEYDYWFFENGKEDK